MGSAGPHIRAVTEGKIAGKLAHDVIDHVPAIQPNEIGKELVNHKTIQGSIEFRSVNFKYPSRPDLQILKSFSCIFE